MLVLTVPEDFDELLKDRSLAAVAALCKSRRVVVVAIDIAIVLIIAVFCSESSRANRAGKVVDMVLAIERGYVRSTKGSTAIGAQKVESSEVVRFAQRILATAILFIDGKEFRCHYLTAILVTCERDNVRSRQKLMLTLHLKHSRWKVPPIARTN